MLHGEQHCALGEHCNFALCVDGKRTVAKRECLCGVTTLEAIVEQVGEEVLRYRIFVEALLKRRHITDGVALGAIGVGYVL